MTHWTSNGHGCLWGDMWHEAWPMTDKGGHKARGLRHAWRMGGCLMDGMHVMDGITQWTIIGWHHTMDHHWLAV